MNSDGLSMGYKNVQPSTHHPSCCLQHHMPGQEFLYKTANNWIPLKFQEKNSKSMQIPWGIVMFDHFCHVRQCPTKNVNPVEPIVSCSIPASTDRIG